MSVVTIRIHDRFGNSCLQYLYARAYARKVGATLQTSPWIGQQIFQLDDPPIERNLPQRYDMDLEQWDGQTDIDLTGWALHQKCLLYTRSDAKEWLKFRPEIQDAYNQVYRQPLVAHLRHGDFVTISQYIAVSRESYVAAAFQFALPANEMFIVCEEYPHMNQKLNEAGMGFLTDFFILMKAENLMRANSTFSLVAAWLGDNDRVFAPNLEGIVPRAGVSQMVPFVEGNWPAISLRHPNCSNLHLAP